MAKKRNDIVNPVTSTESDIGNPKILKKLENITEDGLFKEQEHSFHMKKIVLKMDPVPKNRPRFGKEGNVFDNQSKIKSKAKWLLLSQVKKLNIDEILLGSVAIWLVFFVQIPLSLSKKKQLQMDGLPCDKKPDLDNYLKFILDIMNGIIYEDDKQITRICCEKIWSFQPRTEIWYKKIDS